MKRIAAAAALSAALTGPALGSATHTAPEDAYQCGPNGWTTFTGTVTV